VPSRHRSRGRQRRHVPTAEAAAHPPHLDDDLVRTDPQRLRDDVLRSVRCRRAPDVRQPSSSARRTRDLPRDRVLWPPTKVCPPAGAARASLARGAPHGCIGGSTVSSRRRASCRQHRDAAIRPARGAPRGRARHGCPPPRQAQLPDVLQHAVGGSGRRGRWVLVLARDVGGG
jgi:hypothetical protein